MSITCSPDNLYVERAASIKFFGTIVKSKAFALIIQTSASKPCTNVV